MGVDVALGRANVQVRATLDKLDGDLNDARGKVKGVLGKVASGVGKSFLNIGKLAVGGLAAATGAAVGLGAALAKIAIDAAPLEGISQAFDGLAESAGYGADEMLDALKRGSSGMVSSRDLMMSFNQAAALVSTDFATQLPEAMQYLSKVSASSGQDMGFLLDSLVKGVGRVSPMILDNLGIQVSLADATGRAAEMFGVQADALDKGQVQAGMMNVALEKLASNTAAIPDVTDTAAAKMARMKASFQDTKDQIGMALLPMLSSLLDIFGNLAERILPPVVNFIEDKLAPALEIITGFVDSFIAALLAGQDPITALQGALRDIGLDVVADLIDTVAIKVGELWSTIQPFIETIVQWIAQNVELQDILLVVGAAIATVVLPALASILAPIVGIIAVLAGLVAAVAIVRTAWETDWGGIRTALTNFWENSGKPALEALWTWLQVNIPAAIETAKAFWENTLKPALETVWTFIQESVIPAIGDLVDWLQINIPAAIETAKSFWENTLKPALETVWAFIQDNVIPIIESVVEWLEVNIPAAIQAAADLWENTLKPALEMVWKFAEENLVPLFEAIVELFDVGLTLALTALAGLWENILKPALETIWKFIKDNLQPVFDTLKEFLDDKFKKAIEGATPLLDSIKSALDKIAAAIQPVIDFVKDLTEKLKSIELPDWLTPGSPTPFETGLWGIVKAMRELSGVEMPRLSDGLGTISSSSAVPGALAAPGAGGSPGQTNSFTMNVYTGAPVSTVIQDFEVMRALVGY